MRCRYCFYADVSSRRSIPNYGVMTDDTVTRLMENIYKDLSNGDRLTFAFQGGEPTLAGLSYFEGFVKAVKAQPVKAEVSYVLQTNGILLDDILTHENIF
jgi:uncharacterized protein